MIKVIGFWDVIVVLFKEKFTSVKDLWVRKNF